MKASESLKAKRKIESLARQLNNEFWIARTCHKAIDWKKVAELSWDLAFEAMVAREKVVHGE